MISHIHSGTAKEDFNRRYVEIVKLGPVSTCFDILHPQRYSQERMALIRGILAVLLSVYLLAMLFHSHTQH